MTLLAIFIFIFGLVIGSGLNALEFRYDNKKSFLVGRSICPHCKHELGGWDLIPVLSYLSLSGKCRYCNKKISWHYPVIEVLTAVSFTLYALFSDFIDHTELFSFSFFVSLFAGFVIITLLVFLLLYDAHHQILPNGILLLLGVVGALASWFIFNQTLVNILLGAVIGFGFFGLMYLVSKGKWIGFGDVKFGIALGLTLSSPLIFFCLFAAYIIGAVYAGFVLARKEKGMKDKIAFGPFLSLAAILALIVGPNIIHWYIGLL